MECCPLHIHVARWIRRTVRPQSRAACRNACQNGSSFHTYSARTGCRLCHSAWAYRRLAQERELFVVSIYTGWAARPCCLLPPSGRSQRLPEINRRPPPKALTVRLQWLLAQAAARGFRPYGGNALSSSSCQCSVTFQRGRLSLACSAAPYAPISPEIAGRITSRADLLLERCAGRRR